MNEQLARKEIPKQYRWKTEHIFPNESAWHQEYSLLQKREQEIKNYQGKLVDAATVANCFLLEDKISLSAERLYVYASLRHDEDTRDTKQQALMAKARKMIVQAQEVTSFITPEILSLSEERIKSWMQEQVLKPYKRTLELILRQKPHTLSKKEEALLAQMGIVTQSPGHIFSMLNNADLNFPKIKKGNGEESALTHGNYFQFLENNNRQVRYDAFKAMYDTYDKLKNTIAATLSANITKNHFYARARHYSSSLEMALHADNIPQNVYDNLIHTVHESLPLMHRYMHLRKKLLNVKELHMYDLFAPLVDNFQWEIPFEEAKKIVLESLAPLGEDYSQILQKGFSEGWIDIYENKGKRSGAYKSGPFGTHPYVLLNHKDNLNSMFTLAHEMGHALHSYFSDTNNSYRNAAYTIFSAEVASTLNESLLMHYLVNKTTDPKVKMYLLTYYADQFRTTVFRQTMFAEFEKMIHERSEEGEALTPELLNNIYYDLNVKYYGKEVIVDSDIALEWARIPHFYSSFYVFKYATGFSAATHFSKQILQEGQPALYRYLQFLKSGGKDDSINILKKAGVDMSRPEPIRQAMNVFADLLDQMEELTASQSLS